MKKRLILRHYLVSSQISLLLGRTKAFQNQHSWQIVHSIHKEKLLSDGCHTSLSIRTTVQQGEGSNSSPLSNTSGAAAGAQYPVLGSSVPGRH